MTIDQTTSDFFTAGGTLSPDAPSYVKRPTDDDLYHYIMAGEFCYVLTPRQMGKSSLMIRTAQRLASTGVKSAIVDLTQIGTVDIEDQWYKGILTQIKRRLRLSVDPAAWWEQKKDIPNIQKFIEFFEEMLSEVKEHVVIFIDEIDTTLKLDFRDDFFAGIRAMFNARAENPDLKRVTFVLLGVASPSDLIKDRNRTPFNIGQEISLRPFNRKDARMLEIGLEEIYPKFGQKILDRVFYWTNGHPYLTQKLCQSIVETRFKEYSDIEIDRLVQKLFTSEEASRETNLQFVRDNVLSYPERRVILFLYKKLLRGVEVHDNKNSLPQNHLKLSGLARIEEGKLVVSNKIYSRVFDQRWVNRYTEIDWRYFIIGALSLIIIGFASVFYNDGVRLPNQAATRVNGVPIYRDDKGIKYMADLFRMKPYIFANEYEYKAKDTFFNSLGSWGEQKDLLEITNEKKHPSPDDYETVIKGLYTSLADVDNSGETTKLLHVVYNSLVEMGMQNENIYYEIGYWLDARNDVDGNNLENALSKYTKAINLNPENPATLFERARIYARLGNYEGALKDYDQVIVIVPESNIEPTEVSVINPNIYTPTADLFPTPTISLSMTKFLSTPETTITPPSVATSLIELGNPQFTATVSLELLPPIQPKFLTLGQRTAAVKKDLSQNEALGLFLQKSTSADFSNLLILISTPEPSQNITVINIIETNQTTSQIEQTKVLNQCESSGPIKSTISFSDAGLDNAQKNLVITAEGADISTLARNKLQLAVEEYFALNNTTNQGRTESLEIEVPAQTQKEYKIIWNETRRHGTIEYSEGGVPKSANYSFRIGVELSSSTVRDIDCLSLSTPSIPSVTPTLTVTPTPTEVILGFGYINKGIASTWDTPNGKLIERLGLNHPLTILEQKTIATNFLWYRCRWENNGITREGWVLAEYITFGSPPP